MTGLNAGFLYMETPTLHMHTLKIAVIDTANVPGGYNFELLKEVLATRLQYLPPFRRRVLEVPFGLHHPVWIEDPDFDLDYHVRGNPAQPPRAWRSFVGPVKPPPVAPPPLPQLLGGTFQGVFRLVRRRRAGGALPPPPFSAPAVSFNRALTPHRRFVFASIPLDDVKEIKNALDATVNDIVLALSAAALRRYLQDRGELPEPPLMAGAP